MSLVAEELRALDARRCDNRLRPDYRKAAAAEASPWGPGEVNPDDRAARRRVFRRVVRGKHLTWRDWREFNREAARCGG